MRRDSGLTVIELAFGLAILAVLLGLGIPAFRALLERHRISAAMFAVSSQFAAARMTAVSQRQVVALCPARGADACSGEGDWSGPWLMYRSRRRVSQPASSTDVLQRIPAPGRGALRLLSNTGRPALHYLPDGRSPGSNLRLRVCKDGRLRGEIIVNNAGRTRSQRYDGERGCGE
ncbi:MAG TPA: GspH/FimT family pseudopilin [Variovorax sp.]|nr:GspH/FimT family pseudopilin [Variovorax sp.]